ncbi:MAG: iron-containing alcohol dehydrogenase [Phycisphaerales bacterium]|nr:iron-containing alcohol dehydrogenase [Phycisphaerales bacterium]
MSKCQNEDALPDVLRESGVRIVFGAGSLNRLGAVAADEGATRVLLVSDPGIVRAGHVERALFSLREAGLEVTVFDGVEENPTTDHVAAGVQVARELGIDFLIGLGGGSSMDCAKGINFILTNGGRMQDYWGVGKATNPMLPMIAVPTTSGTGSEAQSFALITDPETHQKMACGDKKALCRAAILDPELTGTMPNDVASATGIDAVAHAVETAATKRRTDLSLAFSREAWQRLEQAFVTAVKNPEETDAREKMLLGAHLAGAAIEASMLGAAHACANPLTARYGIVHGRAVGLMLPHVIRFNAANGENPYADLCDDAEDLATQIESMLEAVGLPRQLKQLDVTPESLHEMAHSAEEQWTAQFNPRQVTADDLLDIYNEAFD